MKKTKAYKILEELLEDLEMKTAFDLYAYGEDNEILLDYVLNHVSPDEVLKELPKDRIAAYAFARCSKELVGVFVNESHFERYCRDEFVEQLFGVD
jgi:hypothetical protein